MLPNTHTVANRKRVKLPFDRACDLDPEYLDVHVCSCDGSACSCKFCQDTLM